MVPFRLDGRVALITGAGSEHGIGRAIAHAFAEAGASVGLVDMDAAGAERNAQQLQPKTEAYGTGVDVTNPESVKSAVQRVEGTLGPVDVLVNCAGITRATPIWETSLDEFDLVMNVNLRGGFVCLQAVLSGMMQRHRGRVIWISSIAGKQGGGVFGAAHYAASKAGVIGLCHAAARRTGVFSSTALRSRAASSSPPVRGSRSVVTRPGAMALLVMPYGPSWRAAAWHRPMTPALLAA